MAKKSKIVENEQRRLTVAHYASRRAELKDAVRRGTPDERAEDLEWQLRARCRGLPTDIFFAFDGARGSLRAAREEHAKKVCRSCTVHRECLRYAMATAERWGIWGATTPAERERIALTKGRPA